MLARLGASANNQEIPDNDAEKIDDLLRASLVLVVAARTLSMTGP
jgi:hypothetical protein